MKQFLSFAALILAAGPLLALTHVSEWPAPAAGPRAMIADMVAGSAAVRPLGAVTPGYGPDYEILLPVVINSPGLNGTFFKTDGFLSNFRNIDQELLVGFIPAGVSAAAQPAARFTFPASAVHPFVDILGPIKGLNVSGVGALLFTAVLPGTNTVDTNGQLFGMFRIYTPQPGSSGTTSFGSWGPPSSTVHGLNGAIAIGLRQNADFRSNVGIVNLDPVNTRSWTVEILAGAQPPPPFTVTLPPLSMQLVAVPANIVTPNGYVSVRYIPFSTPGTDFRWTGFGATADNVTGDSWFSLAAQSGSLPTHNDY